MMDRFHLGAVVLGAMPRHLFQARVSLERGDFGTRPQRDVWRVLDPADEVAGHALSQAIGAHQDMNVVAGAGQEHRGLAGGVAAAYDDNFLIAAKLGFQGAIAAVEEADG